MNTIKKLRIEQGYSQLDLAMKLGVAQNTVSNWENEIRIPRPKHLKAIAKVLNCTIDEILF